jgi:SPP1 family predicted phage head-tail adaptor
MPLMSPTRRRREVGAARRNDLVTVEIDEGTKDASGHHVPDYAAKFDRSAEVLTRGGAETRKFDQLRADVSHIVKVTYDPETKLIRPRTHRLDLDGRKLNIGASFDVDNKHVEIELHCTEIVK